MEEDIKILEKFCKNPIGVNYSETKQAINNILNRLEQDERVIVEMAKWINDLGCIDLDINKDIIDHFRKKCE